MALHSMVQKSTGYTPNELMLGRNVIQPLDLLMGTVDVEHYQRNAGEWFSRLTENLNKVHRFAREKLKSAQLRQKRDYDLRVVEQEFHVGDLVYRVDVSTKVGKKALQPVWLGPYVVEKCRPPLYWARGRKKGGVYHHDKLKLCNDSLVPLWLRRMRNKILAPDRDDDLPDEEPLTDLAGLLEPELAESDQEVLTPGNTVTEDPGPGPDLTQVPVPPMIGGDSEKGEESGKRKCVPPGTVAISDLPDDLVELGRRTRTGRQTRKPAHLRDYDLS